MERVLLVLIIAAALLAGCASEEEEEEGVVLPGGTVKYEVKDTASPVRITYHDENGWPIEITNQTLPWSIDFVIEEGERATVTLYVSAFIAAPPVGSTLTVNIYIDDVVRQTGSVTGDADLFASAKDSF